MKKLMIVLVLAFGGWVGYQYSQTGSLPFGSHAPSSPEEQELAALSEQFQSAQATFRSSLQSAGLTGLDTTADVDAALEQIKGVQSRLAKLKPKLNTPEARKKADELEAAVKDFLARLR